MSFSDREIEEIKALVWSALEDFTGEKQHRPTPIQKAFSDRVNAIVRHLDNVGAQPGVSRRELQLIYNGTGGTEKISSEGWAEVARRRA